MMKIKTYKPLKPEETVTFRRINFFGVTRKFNKEALALHPEMLPVLRISDLTGCEHGFIMIQLSYSDLFAQATAQSYPEYEETYYTVFKNGELDSKNAIPLYPETEGKHLISISIGLCSRTEEATLTLTVNCEEESDLKQVMKKQSDLPGSTIKFHVMQDWSDDLSWCPSQCIKKIEYQGRHFILLLYWRHQDPWTAEITECHPDGTFTPLDDETATYPLNIGYWKDSELRFAKNSAEVGMVEWLREECC
ncbi:MAG TPA: hypothetical protein PKY63_12320 [Bacteroidales bacterium]|nr:hypothetical protein [Bacteroidales bacterium]